MSWTEHRARVAALSRSREPDDPDLVNARRALAAVRFESDIARVVAAAPPLSSAQRDRIALLMRPVLSPKSVATH